MTLLAPWYQKFIIKGKPTTKKGFMNEEYFAKLTHLFPSNLSGKRVLDLGCNAGFISFKLANLGAKVVGFDKDEHYIDQANYVMRANGAKKVKFLLLDVESLLLPAYRPDLVVALSIIYHLSNPEEMIKKLCQLPCNIIASFRLSNFDLYTSIFKSFNKHPVDFASYGRKRAALFR